MAAPPAIVVAARQLSRALISTSSQSWTSSHEQSLHRFLLSRQTPPHGQNLPFSSIPFLSPSLLAASIDPHLLPHPPLALGLFHWASNQPGFSHTPHTFHSLLLSLSTSRRPISLEKTISQAASMGVSLHPRSVFLAASSLLRCGRTLQAFRLLRSVPSDPAFSDIYNSLLAAAADEGLFDIADEVFGDMLLRGVPLSEMGFGVFLHGSCRRLGMDSGMKLVDRMKAHEGKLDGSLMAVMFVDGLCLGGRLEEAWRALEELRLRNYKPDFLSYRIVSEELIKAGKTESSRAVLKQKRKLGVAPMAVNYGKFIQSLISERRIHPAKRLGEALLAGAFPLDSISLNLLIGAVSAVDLASSLAMCRAMAEGRSQPPSLLTLRNLCGNLCNAGKGEEMWDLFQALFSKGFLQEEEEQRLVIFFLCRAGKLREAYQVLREMKKRGLQPSISCYNYLLEGCCKGGLIRPAKKLWDEMFASGCGGDLQTYKILILKLCEEGDVDGAMGLFIHAEKNKKVEFDEVLYLGFVQGLCRLGREEEAMVVVEKAVLQGPVAMAGSVVCSMVVWLCEKGEIEGASALVRRSLPGVSGRSSHVAILRGFALAGLHERGVEHAEWVRGGGNGELVAAVMREFVGYVATSPSLGAFLPLLHGLRCRGLLPDEGRWADLCSGA